VESTTFSQQPQIEAVPFERELPESLDRLMELAHNFWWSWSPEARDIFRSISLSLWRKTDHNPVLMLREITEDRLQKLAIDPPFLKRYQHLLASFDEMLTTKKTEMVKHYPSMADKKIAYFSAEYGLHSSLPIYSGGLGVLAGDICKTSSDLGLDLTAIGFMYPRGYFDQRITADGEQLATYDRIVPVNVAIEHRFLKTGEPAIVSLPLESPDDLLHLQIWQVRCGRVRMYLIDSDLDLNKPWNRDISTRLYGGDQEYRLRQEIALGMGGVRALQLLDVKPDVWHANEGHVAFMLLERLRLAIQSGMDLQTAKEFVRKSSVFTTHTPVPAGHDSFPFPLIERYFAYYWPMLGLDKESFFELGRHAEVWGEGFNMTALSMNLAEQCNAVSKRHEEVTREMWKNQLPDHLTSVTNGIHIPTWIAPEIGKLFDHKLGIDWREHLNDPAYWDKIDAIDDEDFWLTRQHCKGSLMAFVTARIRKGWQAGTLATAGFVPAGAVFEPAILTIGFARRFATYKRATLIFHDLERLKRMLNDPIRPVQFIFSGKAHPVDEGGKQFIKEIYSYAKDPSFNGRIVFIENYDMHVAKNLVRGVDVWMNNPKAPLEASGTSGMKAGVNGVPNFSILDGWWLEGFNGKNGWGLEGSTTGTQAEQDAADASRMYETLEHEIIPLYYDKGSDSIPHGWVQVVKESIKSVIPGFSGERMVGGYISQLYSNAVSK
jgi:starch phosphorylase